MPAPSPAPSPTSIRRRSPRRRQRQPSTALHVDDRRCDRACPELRQPRLIIPGSRSRLHTDQRPIRILELVAHLDQHLQRNRRLLGSRHHLMQLDRLATRKTLCVIGSNVLLIRHVVDESLESVAKARSARASSTVLQYRYLLRASIQTRARDCVAYSTNWI